MSNPVVHFEIGCRDAEKAQRFYGELFDWKFQAFGPARMIDTGAGAGGAGINGHINALGHEPHHYCTVYVQVDDIPAYLAKAERLGAKTVVPVTDVPGMGQFAWINDLDGNIVGLWKPLRG